MILPVLLTSLLAADPCAISGTVALLRDGEKVKNPGAVAVYVDYVSSTEFKQPARVHQMLQKNINFEPNVLVVTVGDKVTFTNEDKVEHSVFSNTDSGTFELPPSKKGFTGAKVFRKPGPVLIQCDIHKKMRADVLVVSNPFATLANPDGTFRISGLPKGSYRLMVWEPNGGESHQEVTCAGETAVSLQVEQARKPILKRKDGTAHREY